MGFGWRGNSVEDLQVNLDVHHLRLHRQTAPATCYLLPAHSLNLVFPFSVLLQAIRVFLSSFIAWFVLHTRFPERHLFVRTAPTGDLG